MNILDEIDDSPAEPCEVQKVWSRFQQEIFEAVRDPSKDLLIQAVAGSGKTTTIIEATKWAPGSSLFMAFNKAIAEDIRSKGPQGEVKTLNALGHRLMGENRPGARLVFKKVLEIIKKIMHEGPEYKEDGYTLSRVVGLAKNCALGLDGEPDVEDFIGLMDAYAFDIPFDKQAVYAAVCHEAFIQSALDHETFDFDDQLWVPIFEGWKFPQFDNVFIDECQDLSPIQHLMAQELKGRGARLVGVGDRHQAIYGFRGASHDSMDLMKLKFGMTELPLSISYRCSQSVVLAAQEFCPTIQWRQDAPQGDVLWERSDPVLFSRHMIVCRTNAPLFSAILAHVRAKAPCQVLSNFLDSFQGFIRGFKATYTSDLMAKLDRWYEREKEACERLNKRGKLYALTDKYQTIKLLCGEFSLVADMVQMVKALGESRTGPIFATIHKAKGLEHQDVYILRPEQLGGFGDLSKEQKVQEDNLHYVAITRAKNTLTYGASRK